MSNKEIKAPLSALMDFTKVKNPNSKKWNFLKKKSYVGTAPTKAIKQPQFN